MQINEKLANQKSKNTLKLIIFLASVLALSIIITVIALFLPTHIRIEAGDAPDFEKIFKTADYEFDPDFNPDCINHPGTYKFQAKYRNRTKIIKLTVKDTKAPEVTLKGKIYVSSKDIKPTPEDFIESIIEADAYTGEFITDMNYDFQIGKSYEIEMRFSDPSGNKTQVQKSVLSYIVDTEPPKIEAPAVIYSKLNAPIMYKQYITVTDNCIGDIQFHVEGFVDNEREGVYKVLVKSMDIAGNMTKVEMSVHIIPPQSTTSIDDLNNRISKICNSIITSDMDTEAKCRAVYDYVQSNIKYNSDSTSKNYIEAAYNALETKKGDCYSFFALSKAFLDYLGIENLEIQRTEGKGEGTHFWNYVNIGTKNAPSWYHFDTTELVYNYNVSGCLLTTAQVEAYDRWREGVYFRHFDKSSVPVSATKIITPITELEKYMK